MRARENANIMGNVQRGDQYNTLDEVAQKHTGAERKKAEWGKRSRWRSSGNSVDVLTFSAEVTGTVAMLAGWEGSYGTRLSSVFVAVVAAVLRARGVADILAVRQAGCWSKFKEHKKKHKE